MIEYLAPDELQTLLDSIPHARDKLLARFLFESGCSISELSALRSSAVHPDGTVDFGDRVSRISPDLARELLAQASTYVFHTRQTPTITPKRVQQILKPYIASLRKNKTTPHILRYTHIVHAYTQGLRLQAISEQTGITAVRVAQIVADIPTTDGYGSFFARGGRT